MDLTKLSKSELFVKCEELGITKYKSKNKEQLIELINDKTLINEKKIYQIEFIIEDGPDEEYNEEEYNEEEDDETPFIEVDNFIIDEQDESEQNIINNINLSNLKYIDLFCGIGGFHQALNQLGAQCVLACDIDKDCRVVYKDNYGLEPVVNVKNIDEKNMPDFDILCAGFPCQAFSNGGKKKCFEDDRGLLFDEIIRIAKEKKPKFMFLENVKHILKVSKGEVISYIKNKIAQTGYTLQLFQISPHNYGIPQQRERVYFVCIRNDIYKGTNIKLPIFIGNYDFKKFLDDKNTIN